MPDRPNFLLILCDDMGYSDIGCFGSEISTPNIDSMARDGIRFTQMYNCARCCPTRASILTGLYAHRAGVGLMVGNRGVPSYQGYLNERCATIGEMLRSAGYSTYMSGKWHVGGGYTGNKPETWRPGEPGHPIPVQRGFDEHYGMLGGGGSYFDPPYMVMNDKLIKPEGLDYYLTDAITQNAVSMIRRAADRDAPFFLYVAYTAPHWPLHALPEDIARYEGTYRTGGWDTVRTSRHEELKGLGILDPAWEISPRDKQAPAWQDAPNKDWEDLRMAVYAAQVDRMDQGIGRMLAVLGELGLEENTVVMFLSDNGGCAEFLAEDTDRPEKFRYNTPTKDGRPMHVGNTPELRPGGDTTFMSYDRSWANASNAPFRFFKKWVHEGGISTPFVVRWPAGIDGADIVHQPYHVVDIPATFYDLAGVQYPKELGGRELASLDGETLAPVLRGTDRTRERPIYFEHMSNRAVRDGIWKLVAESRGPWELYNMQEDRTELNDLAGAEKARVKKMVKMYDEWADRCGVIDWTKREG
jgi:arylsulfatase A-like enzyme